MKALNPPSVTMIHACVSKHKGCSKKAMANLKARAHQVYINVSQMGNAMNVSMIGSALVSVTSVPVMFVSVAYHLNHVTQLIAMNAEMEHVCAVKTLNARKSFRIW